MKTNDKKRWYRYYFSGNGGVTYQYYFGTKDVVDEVADRYLINEIPWSHHWRGIHVEAIKRPPLAWLVERIKSEKASIKYTREYVKFLTEIVEKS